jgi:hypothetical protein
MYNPFMAKLKPKDLLLFNEFLSDDKLSLDAIYDKYIKKNLPDTLILAMVYQKPAMLSIIPKPSLESVEVAVKLNPNNIKYLGTTEIWYAKLPENLATNVVRADPLNILWLKNPSKKVQLLAVSKNYLAFSRIKDPHDDVQLFIADKDPLQLGTLPEPSTEAVLLAISKNPLVIDKLKSPTDYIYHVCKMAGIPQQKDAWKTMKQAQEVLSGMIKKNQKINVNV